METIKNACTALVIAGSIALLLGATWGNNDSAERERKPQKWDYDIGFLSREELATDEYFEAVLAAYKKRGQEGWEYAGIVCPNGANAFYYLWKRPID